MGISIRLVLSMHDTFTVVADSGTLSGGGALGVTIYSCAMIAEKSIELKVNRLYLPSHIYSLCSSSTRKCVSPTVLWVYHTSLGVGTIPAPRADNTLPENPLRTANQHRATAMPPLPRRQDLSENTRDRENMSTSLIRVSV